SIAGALTSFDLCLTWALEYAMAQFREGNLTWTRTIRAGGEDTSYKYNPNTYPGAYYRQSVYGQVWTQSSHLRCSIIRWHIGKIEQRTKRKVLNTKKGSKGNFQRLMRRMRRLDIAIAARKERVKWTIYDTLPTALVSD
ncbi:hypothetical protein CPB86DRAFT_802726, partial [Serendipita vermifera]